MPDEWAKLKEVVGMLYARAKAAEAVSLEKHSDPSIPIAVAGSYKYVLRLMAKLEQPAASEPSHTTSQSRSSRLPPLPPAAPTPATSPHQSDDPPY